MMTKWDSIQADLTPIIPKYWTQDNEEELDDLEISLDEMLELEDEEIEIEEEF